MHFKFQLTEPMRTKSTLLKIIENMIKIRGNLLNCHGPFFVDCVPAGKVLVLDGAPHGQFSYVTDQDPDIVLPNSKRVI